METYDLIVVGAGPAGMEAASRAASLHKKVLVVEKDTVGGTCLNRGCIPTKALLRTARLYQTVKDAEHLGIHASELSFSVNEVFAHAREVSAVISGQGEEALRRAGVEIVKGTAVIGEDLGVSVNGETFHGAHVLAAVGGSPSLPPVEGIRQEGVWTSDDLFAAREFPPMESVVIIGGGVIGVEFAQLFLNLGIKVTILEALPRLISSMDREFGQSLQVSFRKRGAQILTGASVTAVKKTENGWRCVAQDKKGIHETDADRVLVCTGRRPCTDDLFAESLKERLGLVHGYVPVRDMDTMETSVPHLYVAGDLVRNGIQLAHAASAEAVNAVAAMFRAPWHKDLSQVPSCVYTSPECASVGLTQQEAEEKGFKVNVRRRLTLSNGKSVIDEDGRGFAKEVFDAVTGCLLGVQLMCGHASEMIGLLGLAVRQKTTIDMFDSTVMPHPTVSEFL